VRANRLRVWLPGPIGLIGLLAILLATLAPQSAWAQANTDRQQEIGMALDQYAAAKTTDQRAAAVEFLQHFDHKLVAAAVVDHIIASRTGVEATAFNELVEALTPDGCAALLDRFAKTDDPLVKGKLIVALRHCQNAECLRILEACLDDNRPVPFEAHGKHPRRVCDLAYDELFLKLRSDSRYGLDSSRRMKGVISEKTPIKARDALIAKLKAKLTPSPIPSATPVPAKPSPTPSATPVPAKPSPTPSATPVPAKPSTAAITQL